jgi:probable addiction module antidote protein
MDKIYKWDMADHIKTKDDVTGYLEAVLEEQDTELLFEALGDIARSEGMTQLARSLNLSRESPYRSFSRGGTPSFTTIVKLLDILGYKIKVEQKVSA